MPFSEHGCGDDPVTRAAREQMVSRQVAARGVTDERVLAAMRDVPRHLFVPEDLRAQAYEDHPLPIGRGQTISQPFIVALMTAVARPLPGDRALEIGTGSGYQSAVLARLVAQVYTVEVNPALQREGSDRLAALGFTNVTSMLSDGYEGWPAEAPYDIVLVTAAPPEVPAPLLAQLAPGGRLVVPIGGTMQELQLIEKDREGRTSTRTVAPVVFVPLVRPTA